MQHRAIAAAGCLASFLLPALCPAQSLVGAKVHEGSTIELIVIDPVTGTHLPYMSFTATGSVDLYYMGAMPDSTLIGNIWYDDGTANQPGKLITINPFSGAVSMVAFGAPLTNAFVEGIDYSPRHNALLVAFGAKGNFGTNRLALVNSTDASVISASGTLSGVTDLDYVLSSATEDLFLDLNAGSNPRVKHLTALFPNPALGAFASPPTNLTYKDGAIHPTTGEIIFTVDQGARLARLVGNAYSFGSVLADGIHVRGLAWANLPPKSLIPEFAGVCPGDSTTITVTPVGTPPFTYKWFKDNGEIDAIANPSAATDSLSITNAGAGTEGNYHCLITNAIGNHTSADIPFILCRADFNCDGGVDDADFGAFVIAYNILDCADPAMPPGCPADLNADGVVDDGDFTSFVQAYNRLLCGA